MLGLERHTVTLRPHDVRWADLFETERRRLKTVLGNDALAIEHIGSSAVPGLQAKPILDIGVAVQSFESAFTLAAPLGTLGYTFRGEQGIPRRHYFVKGPHYKRTHHLHMLEQTNAEWHNLLLFRDCLRRQPDLTAQYQKLKEQLARRYPHDRKTYTAGKHDFIQDVLRAAHES